CGARLLADSPEATLSQKQLDTSTGFVGRQQEMRELQAALDDALSGQGRLVMLVGEPGIGKTRTAQELAVAAEFQSFHVVWGRCYEEAGTPPYWPWLQLLRSFIRQQALGQLQAEMGPGAAAIAAYENRDDVVRIDTTNFAWLNDNINYVAKQVLEMVDQ
ncbi:MAG: AAA family ATPase, partial [Dehalococcoidia bacterium]